MGYARVLSFYLVGFHHSCREGECRCFLSPEGSLSIRAEDVRYTNRVGGPKSGHPRRSTYDELLLSYLIKLATTPACTSIS